MSNYIVLARKWRPQQFDDVVGQGHIARTLTNAMTTGRLAQAYLFSGPRGVGKTTMARILAKALNCQATDGPTPTPCQQCDSCREITQGISVDVMEIDGASNRGINEIRELREHIQYAPLKGRRRIYIIDEVHMLTNEAFNALLKTLEEPPPHGVFIFATTEVHKVPATIQSRCQQFAFRRLVRREIIERLETIAQSETFSLSPDALEMIAQAADGSLRDALSLMDQAVAYGGPAIADEELRQLLGIIDRRHMAVFFDAIARRDAPAGLQFIRHVVGQGQDVRQFCALVLEWLRHLAVAKLAVTPSPKTEVANLLDLADDERHAVERLASDFSSEELQRLFLLWGRVAEELRGSLDPVCSIEMGLVRSTQLPALEAFGTLLEKVMELEQRLGPASGEELTSGISAAPPELAQAQRSPRSRSTLPQGTSTESGVSPAAPMKAPASDQRPARASEVSSGSDASVQNQRGVEEQHVLKTQWRALVEAVRQKKANLATYLEGAQSVDLTENELVLGYPVESAFTIEMMKKSTNAQCLETVAAQQFQRPLRITFITTERVTEADSGHVNRPATDDHGATGEEIALEPLINKALDLFGGRLVSTPHPMPPPGGGTARQKSREFP